MKNVNLRKMTALAAALALAAQSGMAVISAEETESETAAQTVTEGSDTVTAEVPADDENQSETENRSIRENPIAKCIYNTYSVDNNYDGILSDEELSIVEDVTLDGNYFSKPVTSLGILKKTHVSYLTLTDMKDFDLELLKDLKDLKTLVFAGNTIVKNIEVLGELDLDLLIVDTPESGDCIKPKDVYPYIKCEDITVEKGKIQALRTTPDFKIGYEYYSIEKMPLVQLADRKYAFLIEGVDSSSLGPKVTVSPERAFIYGLAEGESEYTYKDRKGNIIGKAKVTVTAAAEPNDPALVKTEAKPVKVLNTDLDAYPDVAYILYDNGILYTFKDGSLKEFQKNIKDAAITDNKIYSLSEDGVLYRSGHAINDKTDYTVTSASRGLDFIVCSDGCLRCVSDGTVKIIMENVKSLDKGFGMDHVITGIIQDKEGVTSIVYDDLDGKYVKYPLSLQFEPVKIESQESTLNGGLYYVLTADHKIYKIRAFFPVKNVAGFDTLSETKPSASVSLFAENVKDIYSYFYISEDGTAHAFSGGNVYRDEEYIDLSEMIEYGNLGISYSELYALGNDKAGNITNYTGAYFSLRDNEGTERYDFIKDAKPLTHVKMNYGIYQQGDNKYVLIQREDDTLWKYVVETGELSRLDEAINGSEVLTGTDPEPEKTEPKEPSENENKDAEPKEGTPDKKEGSDNVSGDVSGDGRLDVTDLTMISLALLGDTNLTEAQSQVADINHNGKVDLSDLATMRQFLSKKIEKL